jgi:pyruvate/2-oxoglutarate dehydrogenase complex dihydrolipoamide acyltransferase (E2) component
MVKSSTEAAHIPMFHYFDEVSMDNLIATRGQLKSEAEMQVT